MELQVENTFLQARLLLIKQKYIIYQNISFYFRERIKNFILLK